MKKAFDTLVTVLVLVTFMLFFCSMLSAEEKHIYPDYCDLEKLQKSDMTLRELEKRVYFCLKIKNTHGKKV